MARTAAERQAAYRTKRSTAGDNGDRRLNTWVTTGAALALSRLAHRYGVTQREMLERLIIAPDQQIIDSLEPGTVDWEQYVRVTA
jgi:hypothetical protein